MRLSEIDIIRIILSGNNRLADYCLQEIVFGATIDSGEKADIAIVAGNLKMYKERVKKAVELYEQGKVSELLFTGGIGLIPHFNSDYHTPESELMKAYAMDLGVDGSHIIIENKSKNSVANINNSLAIFQGHPELDGAKIALVTSDFHIKRFSGVFNNFNNGIYQDPVLVSALNGYTDENNWRNSTEGRKTVLIEALCLISYARKHLIEDIEIPGLSIIKK